MLITSIFFFNDTATTEIYTLSLHDALPISRGPTSGMNSGSASPHRGSAESYVNQHAELTLAAGRSEEHTSELQSRQYLVCRLLLEKKKLRTLRPTNYVPSAMLFSSLIHPSL